MLESSYKICRHCHSNINSATPHKRSQIPALASASVQCPVSSSGSGAKLDQSAISRDRTNFPFPLLATLLLQTRTRDTQPAPHQQSNMFGNQTGFNNFKETLVVKVLEASTAPALVWLRHVVAAPRALAVFVSPFHHYNHRNDPICNFPDIGTVMFTDGGAATWCNNHQ